MTTVQDWLNANAGTYGELDPSDRQAIHDFTLLWSFFEAQVLDCNGDIPQLQARVAAAADEGGIDLAPFEGALSYFQTRYFDEGKPTGLFDGLWPGSKKAGRVEVEAVLSGAATTAPEKLIALFIIVYRLRNNLFHGSKWAYSFKGQLDNFTHAGTVLMRAIELFRAKGLIDEA